MGNHGAEHTGADTGLAERDITAIIWDGSLKAGLGTGFVEVKSTYSWCTGYVFLVVTYCIDWKMYYV